MGLRYKYLRLLTLCLVWGAFGPVWGQPVTVEGPALEQELITLTRDTPFDQALRVIQTFANQVVVDPQHLNVAIGVNIDRQPWRRALELIADQNRLQVWQRETYYELLPVGAGQGVGEVDDEGTTLDSREVNISAIFFQADRAALRELGIDWSTLSGGRVDVTGTPFTQIRHSLT